jgi:hypothetical protein
MPAQLPPSTIGSIQCQPGQPSRSATASGRRRARRPAAIRHPPAISNWQLRPMQSENTSTRANGSLKVTLRKTATTRHTATPMASWRSKETAVAAHRGNLGAGRAVGGMEGM